MPHSGASVNPSINFPKHLSLLAGVFCMKQRPIQKLDKIPCICHAEVMKYLVTFLAIIVSFIAFIMFSRDQYWFKSMNNAWITTVYGYAGCDKDMIIYRANSTTPEEWAEDKRVNRFTEEDIDKAIHSCREERIVSNGSSSDEKKREKLKYQDNFLKRNLPFLNPSLPLDYRDRSAQPAKGLQMDLDSIRAIQKSSQPVH